MKAYGIELFGWLCCPGHNPEGNWHSKHGSKVRRFTIKNAHSKARHKTKQENQQWIMKPPE